MNQLKYDSVSCSYFIVWYSISIQVIIADIAYTIFVQIALVGVGKIATVILNNNKKYHSIF